MRSFLCKFLFFFSSCATYNSATTIVKYTKGDNIKITIEMVNMGQATSYTIYEYNDTTEQYLILKNNIITSYKIKETYKADTMTSDVDIFISLSANAFECVKKKVIKLKIQKYDRGESPKNPCTTSKGCIVRVDWNDECVEPPVEESLSISEDIKKPKERHETISIFHNVHKLDQELTFIEGDNATISFETDHTSYYMKWIHKKGDETVMEFVGNHNYNISVNMIVSRFDDGTTIHCVVNSQNGHLIKDESPLVKINVKYDINQEFYKVTSAKSKKIMPYYDHTELSCSNYYFKRWLKLSKDGIIDKIQDIDAYVVSESLKLSLYLNETQSNTEYMCIGLAVTPRTYKREILNLFRLIYNASENVEPKSTRSSVSDYIPEIAGVVGATAAILFIVLIYMIWKKPKPRLTSHEVETYASPLAVQYVDIQTTSSNTGRCLLRNETPYARIVGVLEPTGRR